MSDDGVNLPQCGAELEGLGSSHYISDEWSIKTGSIPADAKEFSSQAYLECPSKTDFNGG